MDNQKETSPVAPVELTFIPEKPEFAAAVKEYEDIWSGDGQKITTKLEEFTGLPFWEKTIKVEVFDGVSNSGYRTGDPMKLRHNYTPKDKKGTLIHELGHRIMLINIPPIRGYDNHQLLDLFLYDVWEELYGKEFADEMVEIEGSRKGAKIDYINTWKWALSMTREERQAILKEVIEKAPAIDN